MPDDHTRPIPQFEALEFVFSLGKQRVRLRNGLFIGKTVEFLDGFDAPPAHNIACSSFHGYEGRWRVL